VFAYPVFLDVIACRVLVVGAGAVAARKVRGLLDAGASHIIVVAPVFCPEMPAAEDVTRLTRGFEPADLDGVGLCFAATDSASVNEHVCDLCRKRGIPVNRADHEGGAGSTFTVPAIARAGMVCVAVSAGGSPAIAARLRDTIAKEVLPEWAEFAEAAAGIRREILEGGAVALAVRQAAFRTLASPEAQAAHVRGGAAALRGLLLERHPELGSK
jgi:siroheme synthase-like protein